MHQKCQIIIERTFLFLYTFYPFHISQSPSDFCYRFWIWSSHQKNFSARKQMCIHRFMRRTHRTSMIGLMSIQIISFLQLLTHRMAPKFGNELIIDEWITKWNRLISPKIHSLMCPVLIILFICEALKPSSTFVVFKFDDLSKHDWGGGGGLGESFEHCCECTEIALYLHTEDETIT